MECLKDCYRNKNVLVTGHTGFKGSWLSILLKELGARVTGYSLEPNTDRDNYVQTNLASKLQSYIGDIRDHRKLMQVLTDCQPDFVFHLAAQPLVRRSYMESKETFDVNVMGTINLLEILRSYPKPCAIVIITTDKCYENKESMTGYKEEDRLGGYDPYSASKACVELVVSSYRNSFFHPDTYSSHGKVISTARAGNVIGGGDWREDRLIPDCVRSIRGKKEIVLRNPMSVRPWQYVLEPLFGYLILAEKMKTKGIEYSGAWNFGPEPKSHIRVEKLVELFLSHFRYDRITYSKSAEKLHETNILSLDITKAVTQLDWKPVLTIHEAVGLTAEWYRDFEKTDVYGLSIRQIKTYMKILSQRKRFISN